MTMDFTGKIAIIATTFLTILLAGGFLLSIFGGLMNWIGKGDGEIFIYFGIVCIITAVAIFVFIKKGKE